MPDIQGMAIKARLAKLAKLEKQNEGRPAQAITVIEIHRTFEDGRAEEIEIIDLAEESHEQQITNRKD